MTTPKNASPTIAAIVAMTFAMLAGCGSDPGETPDAGAVPDSGTFVRHEWVIDQLVAGGKREPLTDGGVTDEAVHVHFGRGFAAFAPAGESTEAFGEIHATADGKTYWADAVAPEAELANPEAPIEVRSRIIETHAFIKRDTNATLKMTITAITLETIDENIFDPGPAECGSATARNCTWVTHAEISGNVYAGTLDEKLEEFDFDAFLRGWRNHWESTAGATTDVMLPGGRPSSDFRPDILSHEHFEFDDDVQGHGDGAFARLRLLRPDTIDIPLDRVQVGQIVIFKVDVTSSAQNRRDGEVFVSAHFRDPLEPQGVSLDVSGLESVPIPDNFPRFPRFSPEEAPPCRTTSDPEAGTLQFEQAELFTPEGLQSFMLVPVTRAGGSKGAVSAKLSSADGTAFAGTDYEALSTTVRFGDGVAGTQFLKLSVLDNVLIDGDRTVLLRLSSPKGCAVLGDPAEATLTIFDNDQPVVPPPTFTIGGTISGLAGTGLVLRNLTNGNVVNASGNAFTMPEAVPDGSSYDVVVDTQPTNPIQVCTVANGSGTVSGANVSSIAVTCVAPAPAGSLDPSFGDSGRAVTSVAYTPNLLGARIGMALQSDGKILLVGGLKLLRLKADGTPDSSFATAGVANVMFDGGPLDTAMDVAVQANGKIVVAGTTSTLVVGSDNFALTRFNSDGSLDTTFGSGGHVTTDFFGSTDQVRRMHLQTDGKILVVGFAVQPISASLSSVGFAIARYNADGTLDLTFSLDGKTTDSPGNSFSIANGLAIQSDGKIVVAGSTAPNGAEDPDTGFVRYLGDGQVHLPGTRDDTFGPFNNGTVDAVMPGHDEAVDVVVLGDGTILGAIRFAAGATTGGIAFGFGLAHVPANGVPPPRLPQPIITFTTESDSPRSMLVQSDGKIVVVGQSANLGSNPDMAIARFNGSGLALDTSFGTGGKLTVDFFGGRDGAEAVVQQADGKLVVGGFARSGAGNVFAVVRVAE